MKNLRTAVITGASTGIGRATAEEFAKRGFNLALLARREELLDTLAKKLSKNKTHHISCRCDITRWEQVSAVVKRVEEAFGSINVLINNAGAFEFQPLEKSKIEKLDEMIDVNVRGMVYITKAFLPLLKKEAGARHLAKIINVSSISGLWGFSNMSVYTATKFAVSGFSSGLRRELRNQGIGVATIYPGPVNTQFRSGHRSQNKPFIMFPEEIASQIYRLAMGSSSRVISHPFFSMLNSLESLSPRLVDKILKRVL